MGYDRDLEYARYGRGRDRGERLGRGEYGAAYEAPYRARFHGFAMGYDGGALRSRGSFQAGQLRSGLNPVDEFEFQWGDGYVGGRGYGGTNYDLQHGYRTGGYPRPSRETGPAVGPGRAPGPVSSPATRGGYEWGEEHRAAHEPYGPARYGYGPYHERLLRRRRADEEIRKDVEETLFYDTWVDADRITVEVENGIVTLTGTLPSFEEVRYATDDAWDVDGVSGVRSRLEVAGRREAREPGRGEGRGVGRAAAAPGATEEAGGAEIEAGPVGEPEAATRGPTGTKGRTGARRRGETTGKARSGTRRGAGSGPEGADEGAAKR